MFRIRPEQLTVLRAAHDASRREELVKSLVAALHRRMPPGEALSDRATLTRVVERAVSHDLTEDDDVERYVDLARELGAEFEDLPAHAWMRERLADPSVSEGRARLDRVFDERRRRAVVEAENRRREEAFLRRLSSRS